MADFEGVEKLAYDKEISLEHGYIRGSENVLLIVVGQNGSIYGYNNKYIDIAQYYNKMYGVSVVVVSNPYNGADMLKMSVDFICNLIGADAKICCMGVSNGARLLSQYGHLYPNIDKMLLVNMPLMINWHKTKKGIENFRGECVRFVYGSADPSYGYIGLIELIVNPDVDIKLDIIEEADHNFKGHDKEFMELAECLFRN